MSDCEIPEFYLCHEPVANKAHRCVECKAPIEPGERYLRVSMKYEGECVTEKQHLACAKACEYYRDHIGEDCLYYGELKEYWENDGRDMDKSEAHIREFRRLYSKVLLREHRVARAKPALDRKTSDQ